MALIFFERKDMMLENVLDTQNTVVGRQENILRRLEAGFHSLKAIFRSHGDPEICFFFFTPMAKNRFERVKSNFKPP